VVHADIVLCCLDFCRYIFDVDGDESDDDADGAGFKGPFRDPREVQYMRSRPPCPSLRCQSSYYAVAEARKQYQLDEWVRRVTDDEYG